MGGKREEEGDRGWKKRGKREGKGGKGDELVAGHTSHSWCQCQLARLKQIHNKVLNYQHNVTWLQCNLSPTYLYQHNEIV